MRYCVGITVGPIFDTISGATVPAALWFSSITFSDLTRRLCKGITERIPSARICSPYYDGADAADNDGVGVYHDRVVFSADCEENELKESLRQIVDTARRDTAYVFPDVEENAQSIRRFLEQYLEIHYVILPMERADQRNSVLAVSPYLDALELMKTFPADSGNDPFARLFANDEARDRDEETRNRAIRSSNLFPKNNERYLVNSRGNIRDIHGIAAGGAKDDPKNMKYAHYFAVVNADGDGMGEFLKKLNDGDVTVFSGTCLNYARRASELIFQFGGMPIYAGGDDLLFLSPLYGKINGERCSVLDLCEEIRALFMNAVKDAFDGREDMLNLPTLSFGVSVQFEKFPLYEALAMGRKLLERAKSAHDADGNTVKDNIALELRKHSGQSVPLLIHNPWYESFAQLIEAADMADSSGARSMLYTIETFRPLLGVLHKTSAKALRTGKEPDPVKETFRTAWRNLFDNPGQKSFEAYITGVADAYFDAFVKEEQLVAAVPDAAPLDALCGILRWCKFLEEKAGEKD